MPIAPSKLVASPKPVSLSNHSPPRQSRRRRWITGTAILVVANSCVHWCTSLNELGSAFLWRPHRSRNALRGPPRPRPLTREFRTLEISLVELSEQAAGARHVVKLLLPGSADVAAWWAGGVDLMSSVTPCSPGESCVHVSISGPDAAVLQGMEVDGVRAVVALPRDVSTDTCAVGWEMLATDGGAEMLFPSSGQLRALRLRCTKGGAPVISGRMVFGAVLLKWILLPWPLVFMPAAFWSAVRPIALLAAMICTRGLRWWRKRRRVLQLRVLEHRASNVQDAFGVGEPCCICLAEPSFGETLIALLPCRHALHGECYADWIRTDTYASRDLVCPLCRRQVDAIGRVSVPRTCERNA